MNNITITGNLTKDPITERTASGKMLVRGTLAVNRTYNKETDFFDFVAWENQAEFISKYAKKGDRLEIIGSMENNKYTNKGGETINKWQVRANFVSLASSKKTENSQAIVGPQQAENAFDDIDNLDDDVPF